MNESENNPTADPGTVAALAKSWAGGVAGLWRAGAVRLPLAAAGFAELDTNLNSTTHHGEAFDQLAFQ